MPERTVAVIGLGYIGLPTAAILASKGVNVIGVDVNERHVDAINRGEVPFVEPDLATHVAGAVTQGLLSAQKDMPQAATYIVAVPTPFKEGYAADLSYIHAATDAIIPQLSGGELIILESTSPPGTTNHVAQRVMERRPDLSLDGSGQRPIVHFAHCPERVLPGRIMIELVTNDRIIGGLTPEAAKRASEIYEVFCQAEMHLTDATTAEMAKLTENSFRDVNIAFANELSMIAGRLGVDVFELIQLANKHPRVNILQPGPGVGGHCIAVDPWFLVQAAPQESTLIRAARQVNTRKAEWVVDEVSDRAKNGKHFTISALGLTFKANVDDLRESPAIQIVRALARRLPDVKILVVEPHIERLPSALQPLANLQLVTLDEALDRAELHILLVDHKVFDGRAILERGQEIVDTRGFLSVSR